MFQNLGKVVSEISSTIPEEEVFVLTDQHLKEARALEKKVDERVRNVLRLVTSVQFVNDVPVIPFREVFDANQEEARLEEIKSRASMEVRDDAESYSPEKELLIKRADEYEKTEKQRKRKRRVQFIEDLIWFIIHNEKLITDLPYHSKPSDGTDKIVRPKGLLYLKALTRKLAKIQMIKWYKANLGIQIKQRSKYKRILARIEKYHFMKNLIVDKLLRHFVTSARCRTIYAEMYSLYKELIDYTRTKRAHMSINKRHAYIFKMQSMLRDKLAKKDAGIMRTKYLNKRYVEARRKRFWYGRDKEKYSSRTFNFKPSATSCSNLIQYWREFLIDERKVSRAEFNTYHAQLPKIRKPRMVFTYKTVDTRAVQVHVAKELASATRKKLHPKFLDKVDELLRKRKKAAKLFEETSPELDELERVRKKIMREILTERMLRSSGPKAGENPRHRRPKNFPGVRHLKPEYFSTSKKEFAFKRSRNKVDADFLDDGAPYEKPSSRTHLNEIPKEKPHAHNIRQMKKISPKKYLPPLNTKNRPNHSDFVGSKVPHKRRQKLSTLQPSNINVSENRSKKTAKTPSETFKRKSTKNIGFPTVKKVRELLSKTYLPPLTKLKKDKDFESKFIFNRNTNKIFQQSTKTKLRQMSTNIKTKCNSNLKSARKSNLNRRHECKIHNKCPTNSKVSTITYCKSYNPYSFGGKPSNRNVSKYQHRNGTQISMIKGKWKLPKLPKDRNNRPTEKNWKQGSVKLPPLFHPAQKKIQQNIASIQSRQRETRQKRNNTHLTYPERSINNKTKIKSSSKKTISHIPSIKDRSHTKIPRNRITDGEEIGSKKATIHKGLLNRSKKYTEKLRKKFDIEELMKFTFSKEMRTASDEEALARVKRISNTLLIRGDSLIQTIQRNKPVFPMKTNPKEEEKNARRKQMQTELVDKAIKQFLDRQQRLFQKAINKKQIREEFLIKKERDITRKTTERQKLLKFPVPKDEHIQLNELLGGKFWGSSWKRFYIKRNGRKVASRVMLQKSLQARIYPWKSYSLVKPYKNDPRFRYLFIVCGFDLTPRKFRSEKFEYATYTYGAVKYCSNILKQSDAIRNKTTLSDRTLSVASKDSALTSVVIEKPKHRRDSIKFAQSFASESNDFIYEMMNAELSNITPPSQETKPKDDVPEMFTLRSELVPKYENELDIKLFKVTLKESETMDLFYHETNIVYLSDHSIAQRPSSSYGGTSEDKYNYSIAKESVELSFKRKYSSYYREVTFDEVGTQALPPTMYNAKVGIEAPIRKNAATSVTKADFNEIMQFEWTPSRKSQSVGMPRDDESAMSELEYDENDPLTVVTMSEFNDALNMVSRVLCSNVFGRKQLWFCGKYVDPCAKIIDISYHGSHLWTFQDFRIQLSQLVVSSISINTENCNLVAVGYAKTDICKHDKGIVCVWNVKNVFTPDKVIRFERSISHVEFSSPSTISVATKGGYMAFINVCKKKQPVIFCNKGSSIASHLPIWQISWFESEDGHKYPVTGGADGYLYRYRTDGTFFPTELMSVDYKEGVLKGLTDRFYSFRRPRTTAKPEVTAFVQLPNNKKQYLIGTSDGCIHICECGIKYHLDVFLAQYGRVSAIKFHPSCDHIFMTVGGDFYSRIWAFGIFEPLLTVGIRNTYIEDACFSQNWPEIFFTLSGYFVDIWNIRRRVDSPVQTVFNPKCIINTSMSLSSDGYTIFLGDEGGYVHAIRLKEMPCEPNMKAEVLSEALKRALSGKTKILRALRKLGYPFDIDIEHTHYGEYNRRIQHENIRKGIPVKNNKVEFDNKISKVNFAQN